MAPNSSGNVAVIDDGWAAKSLTGIITKEGDRHENLDLRLCRGTLIRGTVTIGPDNKPDDGTDRSYVSPTLIQLGPKLPDEWRWRFQPRTMLVRWASLDAHGHYAFRVGPGDYDLRLPSNWMEPKRIVVADQREIVVDDHIPKVLPRSLHGRVVDKAGKPVRDAVVAFSSYQHVKTDKAGRFSAGIGAGGHAAYTPEAPREIWPGRN